jgi:hypothetical protein
VIHIRTTFEILRYSIESNTDVISRHCHKNATKGIIQPRYRLYSCKCRWYMMIMTGILRKIHGIKPNMKFCGGLIRSKLIVACKTHDIK